MEGVLWIAKKGQASQRFIGTFEIWKARLVTYYLVLPSDLMSSYCLSCFNALKVPLYLYHEDVHLDKNLSYIDHWATTIDKKVRCYAQRISFR